MQLGSEDAALVDGGLRSGCEDGESLCEGAGDERGDDGERLHVVYEVLRCAETLEMSECRPMSPAVALFIHKMGHIRTVS